MKNSFKGAIAGCFISCTWIIVAKNVNAEEERCRDLGVNCVASDPSNASTLSWGGVDGRNYDLPDSVTKECDLDNGSSGWVGWTWNAVTQSEDSNALSAMPSGAAVSYFTKGPSGSTGIWYHGHKFGSNQYLKRTALRWYQYWSPDFQFKNQAETSCENSKFFEFGHNSHIDLNDDYGANAILFYTFADWSPSVDASAYGSNPPDFDTELKGHWWRMEVVVTNRHGIAMDQNTRIQLYMNNVTDSGPERLVLDVDPGRKSPDIDQMYLNLYRQGSCLGWTGISHVLAAGWDVDSGQRIGPAFEVETDNPVAQRTSPPTNLRIAQ